MWLKLLFISAVMILPTAAHAAVYISEIAWMGSFESANYEWIELFNDGSAQNLDGWILTDGMNLSIDLEGQIAGGEFAVLERTSDASANGSAFLIYTGALVNTGATLKLLRSDGSIEDQVHGGEDWSLVGGDNITKETAQYSQTGWVTGSPTPGQVNNGVSVTEEDVSEKNKDEKPKTGSSGKTTKLELKDSALKLSIESLDVGYVNQPIEFTVEPSGIGNNLINSLNYEWNFGDTYTANNKDTVHSFAHPGTYVVSVYASFKRQEQVARKEFTVLPVKLSLTVSRSGDVQVNNDSPYEVDISGYKLVGFETVKFPPRSIIMPNQTITIDKERVGNPENYLLAIYDTEGVLINSITQNKSLLGGLEKEPLVTASYVETFSNNLLKIKNDDTFSFLDEEDNEPEESQKVVLLNNEDNLEKVLSTNSSDPKSNLSYLLLIGVLVLGTFGLLVKPKIN